MKICKICSIEKELSDFNKRENGKYRNECRDCKKSYSRHYRNGNDNNPYVIDKSIKICNTCGVEKPSEEFIKQKRICKICRKDKDKEYYSKTKEVRMSRNKKIYEQNTEEIKKKTSKYSKENRDKVNRLKRKYKKEVLSKDPLYLIKASIGSSIRRALKIRNIPKKFKTGDILGCSLLELKSHIEKLFLEKMSWDNRSDWHIDHIIPLSIAITEEDVVLLNHYTNLQPLWSKDNIIKSDNIKDINHPIYLKIMSMREQKSLD